MPLLNWVNDTRARSAASEVPFHLLKKISSYGDESEAKENLLIQGDNLLALKALLPFYRGKVKVHLPLMEKEREDVDFPLRIQSKIIRFSEKNTEVFEHLLSSFNIKVELYS